MVIPLLPADMIPQVVSVSNTYEAERNNTKKKKTNP